MRTKTLDVLFEETLRDIYYAERKILRTLPKLARTAQSQDLRAAGGLSHLWACAGFPSAGAEGERSRSWTGPGSGRSFSQCRRG